MLTTTLFFDFIDKNITTTGKEKIKSDIENYLVLSAIGGRTCYSQNVIDEIFNNEPRLTYQIIEYLRRIAKLHHFSIFSHTYITTDLLNIKIKPTNVENIVLFSNIYKLKIENINVEKEKSNISVDIKFTSTLRHFIEVFYQIAEDRDNFFDELLNYFSIDVDNVINNSLQVIEVLKNNYTQIYQYNDNKTSFTYYMYPDDKKVFLILENIPRYISHQIVRHTSLNFSQQSQRYVKLKIQNSNSLNPLTYSYLKEKLNIPDYRISVIQNDVLTSNLKYINYLSDMPAEISRLILPEQTSTILTISGLYDDIIYFIEKRLDNHSQYEVRKISEVIYEKIKR